MARKNGVWKRKGTDWYYTNHWDAKSQKWKKVRLSQDRAEAERLMFGLLAQEEPEETPSSLVSPTFRKLADQFYENSLQVNKPTTWRMHKIYLQSFLDHVKKKRVKDLKVHHVSEWITKTGWGESTACSARGTVLAVLNWAVEQGYIDRHPLAKLKRGSHKRRERVFTTEELDRICKFVKPDFSAFLRALELTGARPFAELAFVTATTKGWEEHISVAVGKRWKGPLPKPAVVDWKEKTITFDEHKNERKGKTRTIYMTEALVELLKKQAELHPTGLLFRNVKGKLWTSHDATRRLLYATETLGIPRGTIYAVRHKLINDGLAMGMSANVIAELVGNSPVTISRHYDHLSKQKKTMLKAAEQITSKPPPDPEKNATEAGKDDPK